MVATIIKNVTSKGIEAAKAPASSTNSIPSASSPFSRENDGNALKPLVDRKEADGYIEIFSKYASDAFSSATDGIYTASDEASKHILSLASSFYSPIQTDMNVHKQVNDKGNFDLPTSQKTSEATSTPRKWFINDPYNIVTGGSRRYLPPTHHRKSVMAVRNLLELVNIDESDESPSSWEKRTVRVNEGMKLIESEVSMNHIDDVSQTESFGEIIAVNGTNGEEFNSSGRPIRQISKAETASRLSEGTVRAMRDMALNEALELHHALRFWTERLERPILFYLEFGSHWWSKDVRDHSDVGQKVSQLQAVIARRCSSIGQLQQHLWRAGWSSGVEQWGILGQGEWAVVVGGHGLIDDNKGIFPSFETRQSPKTKSKRNKKDYYAESHHFVKNVRGGRIVRNDPALAAWSIDAIRVVRDQLYSAGNGKASLPKFENWPRELRHFGEAKEDGQKGEGLWDSMISLEGNVFDGDEDSLDIPLWATYDMGHDSLTSDEEYPQKYYLLSPELSHSRPESKKSQIKRSGDLVISDLGLMAAEVAEILNSMEKIMSQRRRRRLEKLRPPPRILRRWYLVAIGIPVAGYLAYNLTKENRGVKLAKEIYQQAVNFCAEHISEPLQSM
jgi:hypothetical protein